MNQNASDRCRLYLITPPRLDPALFAEVLARTLDSGDVACVQLRLKGENGAVSEEAAIREASERLGAIVQGRDVAFILNDHPDLAAELGFDGVHVGQEDAPYAAARAAVGADAIVGVTCHDSRHLAMTAGEKGADYVAFGAFYDTDTKEAKARAGLEILEWWSEIATVPAVAIGGITVGNCEPLIRAGADFLAVSSGVWNYPEGPEAAVRAFNEVMERVKAEGG
ncbi:MAG: thiamine phosphate synthase [Rhodospirillales bacterium]|nr:thiamine phosphate synthase [Rhodospirillales bacterium]